MSMCGTRWEAAKSACASVSSTTKVGLSCWPAARAASSSVPESSRYSWLVSPMLLNANFVRSTEPASTVSSKTSVRVLSAVLAVALSSSGTCASGESASRLAPDTAASEFPVTSETYPASRDSETLEPGAARNAFIAERCASVKRASIRVECCAPGSATDEAPCGMV